jgi:hypothetical protein
MVQNVALFQGVDADGNIGLWETNGTGSGTFELTPITGAAASGTPSSPSGLSPSNLVGFNGGALFEGKDSSGRFGLWVTTGTAAGTQEIAGTSGLSPNDLTVFGGQVLFSGGSGLWATNGTAAGTHEVTSVAGAPGDLTVFGSEVLFAGATGGLWETDGSSGGTHELAGTAGLNPFDLTVFGSEVLFAGGTGLWETNGATATEIPGTAGLDPSDLTVFGSEVLFAGGTGLGLWETNGATTTEIPGTAGLDPRFMTVYNGEVLFNGADASGHGLWAWNGTSATELVAGIDPSNFTLYNGIALFSGLDSNGHAQLWETNGTAAGTHELVSGPDTLTGLVPFDLTAVSIATPPPPSTTNFSVLDTTTNTPLQTNGTPYSGPVAGLQWELIDTTTDNLNVTANVPNVFIHTGSGEDAINVSHANGNNVLDGSTGSNFLVGGSGNDTFFVDDRSPSADIWSTVSNFHAGDAATIFGITQSGFDTSWVDGQGATGFTGLTLHVTGAGHPTASLTLAGFSTADLSDGRISTSFGHEADGTPYLYVHANS